MGRVLEPEVMEGAEEASAYDELERRWGNVIFQGFAETALNMGVASGRVLDVGTGSGWVAIRVARLNPEFRIDAIDLAHSMIDLATANARRERTGNITFSIGDAKQIPFDDQTFDLVICHQLLHQLPDPVVALREMNRVVKRNGALLVRDVRRLPEPLMTMALPFWCLGYSRRLREQTMASFRAGLTREEFRRLAADAGLTRFSVTTHALTHQTVCRTAEPGVDASRSRVPAYPFLTRLLKGAFVSSPRSATAR